MNYFDGTLADLLTDDYGGEEIYGEEVKTVCELLNESDSSKITFTSSDEDYEGTEIIYKHILNTTPMKEISGYALYLYNGVECVYKYEEGGLVVIFIKTENKGKL